MKHLPNKVNDLVMHQASSARTAILDVVFMVAGAQDLKVLKAKQDLPITLLNTMTKELVITEQITNKICHELMNGTPLARIARDKDMPGLTRIYKEITNNKSFSNRIQECRRIGAQSYIEKAMDELEHADNRNIMIVREKVQLAKWLASKLIPIYGDRQEIKQETKIEITWSNDNKSMINVNVPEEINDV